MGKFSGSGRKPSSFAPPRTPPPPSDDDEEEEEDDEEDFDEEHGGFEDISDDGDASTSSKDLEQSLSVLKQYLQDPLAAFLTNPREPITAEQARCIYAARGIVAKEIDPLLASDSAFANEFRAMEQKTMAQMNEKLFKPRLAAALKEVAAISAEELHETGTGLMWSTVLHSVAVKTADSTPEPLIEYTPQDEHIFNHCIDVLPSYVDNDPFKGVQFTFRFAKNPFFKNTELRCAFHYPVASLSLSKFGVQFPCITAVTSDTPVEWLASQKFETVPDKVIKKSEVKTLEAVLAAFIPTESAAEVRKILCAYPRPLFTMLFDINTSAAGRGALEKAILTSQTPSGATATDSASDSAAALMKSDTMGLTPWSILSRALLKAAKAPMITAMDEEDNLEAIGGDDEEDEEEEEEESESDEETAGPGLKKHRRERVAQAPPKQDCKQQ